jgi:hypothetical protein
MTDVDGDVIAPILCSRAGGDMKLASFEHLAVERVAVVEGEETADIFSNGSKPTGSTLWCRCDQSHMQ